MYTGCTTGSFRFSHRQCVALVFGCTVLGAAAQVLMKIGSAVLARPDLVAILTSVTLLGGYSLYGLSTALLVLALRDGQLSVLYPVVSLTYVWVTALSVMLFKEPLNAFKVLGVAAIVAGVTVLGRNTNP
jgi:multidrug transporter EmrE-like cation transporter